MKYSLKEFIEGAQKAYYEGTPIISDEQYDEIIKVYSTSIEEDIGPEGDFKHIRPMYSLSKKFTNRGDVIEPLSDDDVESIKLDGAAIEVGYTNLNALKQNEEPIFLLCWLNTRGNTEKGKRLDIKKAEALNIPKIIKFSNIYGYELPKRGNIYSLQITGEVVATKHVDNARNIVSGKLNLKSLNEFNDAVEQYGLTFFAYSVLTDTSYITDKYKTDMDLLHYLGFNTVLHVDDFKKIHKDCQIKSDGKVVRVNSNKLYWELGFTAKYPRGAYAVKTDQPYVESVLLDVEWNVGRTGKVVPTAIIEPIDIEGATVSRATLNNPIFIQEMGLYIGCTVKIIRSGEIIPCIIGIVE
jgi:DNA ligase (NAD+)